MSSVCATASFAPTHGSPVRRSALARWGVRLALLAVLAGLLAPLARLSAEVATGQLGSLCLASAVYGLNTDGATPSAPDGADATVGLDTCQACASSLLTPCRMHLLAMRPDGGAQALKPAAERQARPDFERPPSQAPPALA